MGRAGTRPRYTLHFTATKFREQRFVCRQAEKMELFLLCWPCTSVTNHLVNCAPCSNPSTTLPGRKKNQQAPTHNPPLRRPNRHLSLSKTIPNNLFHKYKITLVGGRGGYVCTDLYNELFAKEKLQGSSWSRSESKTMQKQEQDRAKPLTAAGTALGRGTLLQTSTIDYRQCRKCLSSKN